MNTRIIPILMFTTQLFAMNLALSHEGNFQDQVIKRFTNWVPEESVDLVSLTKPSLPYRIVGADDGHSFLQVDCDAEPLEIPGRKILNLSAHPSGQCIYAAVEYQSAIFVLDPETWKVIGEIPCPRFPSSVWCSATRLVVGCEESKVMTFFDLKTHIPVFAATATSDFTIKDKEVELTPAKVLRRTPDGSLVTLWTESLTKELRGFRYVVLVKEQEDSLVLGGGRLDTCCFVDSGRFLTYQYLRSATRGSMEIVSTSYQGPFEFAKSITLEDKAIHALSVGRGGKVFMLPHVTGSASERNYQEETLIFNESMSYVEAKIPGVILGEFEGQFVAVEKVASPGKIPHVEIRFVENQSLKASRIINVYKMRDFRIQNMRIIWVPGHEVLIFENAAESGQWSYVRCGPVPQSLMSKVTRSRVSLTNKLPTEWNVNELLRIKLAVDGVPEGALPTFKLLQAPPGMKFNSESGELTFLPNEVNLGQCKASIACQFEGKEYLVAEWDFEVKSSTR